MDSWRARLVRKSPAERDLADKAALGSSLPEGKLLRRRIGVEFGRIRNQRDEFQIELRCSKLLEGKFEKFRFVWAGEVREDRDLAD